MSHHVLVVSRWYPAFDQPGSGSFVADHVAALRASGARMTVASFDHIRVGTIRDDAERLRPIESWWARAVRQPSALAIPRTLGAGVPVARLPVMKTWVGAADTDTAELVTRHAGVLEAFGSSYAARSSAVGDPVAVIHAHTGIPDGLAAMSLARRLAVPLVVTEHDSTLPRRLSDPKARAAYLELLAVGRVVAVSQALADRIERALAHDGALIEPLEVIPNPVPLEPFRSPDHGRRDLDEALWVGARAEHKGMETLLRAMKIAIDARPGMRLRLIGPSTASSDVRWEALAAELGISGDVSFEPRTDRAGVSRAMHRAGLFVHPSPWETFGMVAAEALASGLPVAATRSGGVEEIIGTSADCELANGPGPGDLAAAIVRLRDRLPSISRDGLVDTIATRYAPALVAEQTLALYERLGVASRDPAGHGIAGLDLPPQAPPKSRPVAALVVARRSDSHAKLAALPRNGPVRFLIVGPAAWIRPSAEGRVVTRRVRSLVSRVINRVRRTLIHSPVPPRPAAESRAIRSAWAELGGGGRFIRWRVRREENGVVIVPNDADDLESAYAALGVRAMNHLAPGSLRWLADQQDGEEEAVAS